ncbi:calmodulin-binding protein 60 A-like [Hibiscus syriacus]|uniref:calmodulin-binding protein 60 A-like n=1 Tax=Hibiscus syriacus TaxID=106335 RepID=UPI0019226D29|nr:calmodulin-binding protein 60 A-like [Hibiscus syriacus]
MSQKRPQEDGKARPSEAFSPDQDKRRRVPTLRNVVQEVMKLQSVQHLLEPVLEPLIRRVVREEVEAALRKNLNNMKRNGGKEVNSTESRSLQLQFLNNLSLPVFTGARIEAEECSAVKVAMVDALTGQIVSSGPEASAKVEIVVLEGDFDGDEGDNWTLEEFKNNIVREREGKKPLLAGDAFLTLTEGIGLVDEISFSDNSSWTRSRRFRLGARVVDGSDGTRVKEAKTESFIVRDHRGELYKKHHPPSLSDEVWRLEKIGKDGAFHKRLSRENINSVKDFLTMLFIDPPRLRHILGTGMSAKMWDVTVEHAQTCVLDKRVYLYCSPGSLQKFGVVFNIVGQVTGLLLECQYITLDKLSETEKAFSTEIRCSLQHCRTRQFFTVFDHYSWGMSGLDDYTCMYRNMCLRSYDPLRYPGRVTNSLICDTDISQSFCDEDHLRFFDNDLQQQSLGLESQVDLQTAVDGFLLQRNVAVKAQRRWTKVFSVLKWFSIKRKVKEKFRGLQI